MISALRFNVTQSEEAVMVWLFIWEAISVAPRGRKLCHIYSKGSFKRKYHLFYEEQDALVLGSSLIRSRILNSVIPDLIIHFIHNFNRWDTRFLMNSKIHCKQLHHSRWLLSVELCIPLSATAVHCRSMCMQKTTQVQNIDQAWWKYWKKMQLISNWRGTYEPNTGNTQQGGQWRNRKATLKEIIILYHFWYCHFNAAKKIWLLLF